jgi:hypothetical protein
MTEKKTSKKETPTTLSGLAERIKTLVEGANQNLENLERVILDTESIISSEIVDDLNDIAEELDVASCLCDDLYANIDDIADRLEIVKKDIVSAERFI